MHTIQVKALSRKNSVPFGKSENLMAEFLIICVLNEHPEIYILTNEEVPLALHRSEKEGRISYWLEPRSYEDHKDHWELIGNGLSV
jgi:hypothetical protein